MAPRRLSSSRVTTLRRKYSITRCRCASLSAPSGVWGSSTTTRSPPLPVTAAPTEVASIRPRWAFQYSFASVGRVNDRDAGADEVPGRRPAAIMEESPGHPGPSTRLGPRRPPGPDRDRISPKHYGILSLSLGPSAGQHRGNGRHNRQHPPNPRVGPFRRQAHDAPALVDFASAQLQNLTLPPARVVGEVEDILVRGWEVPADRFGVRMFEEPLARPACLQSLRTGPAGGRARQPESPAAASATLRAWTRSGQWRGGAADSLSVRHFLDLDLHEAPPDHSTVSRTRRLIDVETHQAVFTWVSEDEARLFQYQGLIMKSLNTDRAQ